MAERKQRKQIKKHKRTPETLLKLEQAFSMGCSNPEACLFARIGESTFYEWMNDDPALSERLKALKNKPILKARKTIVDNLDDPNHAKWYLERKLKKEFGTAKDEPDQVIVNNIMPVPAVDNIDDWEKVAEQQQSEILGSE